MNRSRHRTDANARDTSDKFGHSYLPLYRHMRIGSQLQHCASVSTFVISTGDLAVRIQQR